jgi:hypothetical protein
MPLTSQAADFFSAVNFADPFFSTSVTIQVPNVTTLAEISLTHLLASTSDPFHNVSARIEQIVSASGVEEPGVPVVFREGVTSITFIISLNHASVGARWMLHFYT